MSRTLTTPGFWNQNYGDRGRSYPSRFSRYDRSLMSLMQPFLEPKSGRTLLEMGCGNSYWLPYFAKEYGFTVSGIDFSQPRLLKALENLKKHGQSGELICTDLQQDQTAHDKFDVVCSFGVVEHFDPPHSMLERFSHYMRPGSVLITTVPHLAGFWGNLSSRISQKVRSGYIEMDITGLITAHYRAGFTVIHSQYFRWMDPGVVNFAGLNLAKRLCAYGVSALANTLISPVDCIRTHDWLPETYYADMIVVARKDQQV